MQELEILTVLDPSLFCIELWVCCGYLSGLGCGRSCGAAASAEHHKLNRSTGDSVVVDRPQYVQFLAITDIVPQLCLLQV